jgi:hypothetical protein
MVCGFAGLWFVGVWPATSHADVVGAANLAAPRMASIVTQIAGTLD